MGEQDLKGIYMEKEDAVSPVIATILMVAITVVLAATVYILVSHYTSTGATTPFTATLSEQSSSGNNVVLVLSFTTPNTALTLSKVNILITGLSVATVSANKVYVNITNPNGEADAYNGTVAAAGTTISVSSTDLSGGSYPIASGATIEIGLGNSVPATFTWSGATISLTYSGYSGSATTVLS